MAGKNPIISEELEHYVSQVISQENTVQKRLRTETAKLPQGRIQTTADQCVFFAFLLRLLGAKKVVEIGTFTGCSTLAMALAMPADGKIVTCDISKEWTDIARRYWREAGVDERIELRIAPALQTLTTLAKSAAGSFDFAFIDADKTGYDGYYEACLKLLRPGGVIALDNMLWSGAVADNSVQDADTKALRALNAKIRDDKRVSASLLTVADGIMLAVKH